MGYIVSEKSKGFVVKDKSSGFLLKDRSVGKIESTTEGYIYMEDKIIRVGEPMGLLLSLTYPTTVNFIGERI